jgi:hypothetical protein
VQPIRPELKRHSCSTSPTQTTDVPRPARVWGNLGISLFGPITAVYVISTPGGQLT